MKNIKLADKQTKLLLDKLTKGVEQTSLSTVSVRKEQVVLNDFYGDND